MRCKNPRILLFSEVDINHPYGVHIRPFYLAKYLCQQGYEIITTCIYGVKSSPCPKYIEIPQISRGFAARRYLFHLMAARRIIAKINPDLIYAHLHMPSLTVGVLKRLKFFEAPLLVDMHGSWSLESEMHGSPESKIIPILKFIERLCLNLADEIVVVSNELRNFFMENYKISPSKIIVIPNGVDQDAFSVFSRLQKENARKRLGLADKKVIIFSAPRYARNYANIVAIRFMYRVMNIVKKEDPRVTLLILGGGPMVGFPPSNVVYTGHVKDLNTYLNCADVAVSPYPRGAAAGGARNKTLEYFICKIPVVSTKEGMRGINELIPEKHYYISNDDPSEFSGKILRALRIDHKERMKMVESSYRLITSKYGWQNNASKLCDAFRNLIGDRFRSHNYF